MSLAASPTPCPAAESAESAEPAELPRRPLLSPAVRRLWRDPHSVQFGRRPGAPVLCGVDEPVREALSRLDGAHTLETWQRAAVAHGCSPARAQQLLTLLGQAGLLEDAALGPPGQPGVPPGLVAGRRRACVLVVGAGRIGALLAGVLVASGIGDVQVQDDGWVSPGDVGVGAATAGDVGRRRGEVVRARLPAPRHTPPDLVVLAPVGALPDEHRTPELLRTGTPHLLVEAYEGRAVVGPLVLPGLTPCLHCLDLTRADRDPDWPVLAAQLSLPRAAAPVEASLAVSAAGAAAQQVLTAVDERACPAAAGSTLELVPPDWRWRRREWPAHADCPCGAAGGSG